jgi:fructose-1-phosphate kinase PfkB-like protein
VKDAWSERIAPCPSLSVLCRMSALDSTSVLVGTCVGAALLRVCAPATPPPPPATEAVGWPSSDTKSRGLTEADTPAEQSSASTKPQIVCVGLNPAYQKSMKFDELVVDAVNRAEAIYFSAGGKGQHCAVAANLYCPGCAEVAQFLGEEGPAGMFIADYLRNKQVPTTALTEWVPGMRTRMCTTLLYGNEGAMTELIDPSERIPTHHVGALTTRLMAAMLRPETRAVVVCGTFPPGVGSSLYTEIAAAKLGMGIHSPILVIDAYKGIGDALSTGACDLLKINAAELHALVAGGEAGVEGLGREEVVLRDMELAFHPRGGPMSSCPATSALAITDGPSAAYLRRGTGELWKLTIPSLRGAVNPIGAGDCVTGVMVAALVAGDQLVDAFAKGLAAATASCKGMQGAVYSQAAFEALQKGIKIESL